MPSAPKSARTALWPALCLLLTLCLTPPAPAEDRPTAPPDGGAARLQVFRVGGGQRSVGGLGTVRCRRTRSLGFAVAGVLVEAPLEEGAAVAKGQVLARLDDDVLSADLAAKRAETEEAAAEYKRQKAKRDDLAALVAARAATPAEAKEAGFALEAAGARLARVRAEGASLEVRLRQQVLRAPLDGVVLKRLAEPGEVVTPQSPVLELGECATVLAEVEFGERLYHVLQAGQPAQLTADALPGKTFSGQVWAKSPMIDDKNRTFVAKVSVANPDLALKPGMFVRAVVAAGEPESVLWVPEASLHNDGGESAEVAVLVEGKPERRAVTLGRRAGGRAEVLSGLEAGDLVVMPRGAPAPAAVPAAPPVEAGQAPR